MIVDDGNDYMIIQSISIYIYICIYICIYLYIFDHMCIYIYIFVYNCIYIYRGTSLSDKPTWHPHMLEFSPVCPSPCQLHAESAAAGAGIFLLPSL